MTPPYVCPYCKREFSREHSLKRHKVLFESGGKCRYPGMKLNEPKKVKKKTQFDPLYQRERAIKKRSKNPEKYPHKCPKCEFRSESRTGLNIHLGWLHTEVIVFKNDIVKRNKKRGGNPQFDKETLDWVEIKTIKNILHQCGGNVKKLMNGQRRILRDYGIINSRRAHRLNFTESGLELLEEIRNEEKNPE